MILTGKRANRVEGVEPHERDELDLFAGRAAEELDAAIAWNRPRCDAAEDLLPEQPFVRVRVVRPRVPVPEPGDHAPHSPVSPVSARPSVPFQASRLSMPLDPSPCANAVRAAAIRSCSTIAC